MRKTLHSPAYESLLALLRKTRENAGFRQVDLADRLGRHQSYISKIEQGERRLDMVELREILQALDISLTSFIQRWERHLP